MKLLAALALLLASSFVAPSLVGVPPTAASSVQDKPWSEILGPAQGASPKPFAKVEWRGDVRKALEEAQKTGRPLFVTIRCLPCKQCSGFDAAVLEGGDGLDSVLAQFVTVRITSASDLDLRLFPIEGWQDLDLSWWGWVFSPEGRIYSIFGGKDHVSDATRISPAALKKTLERALAHHYDPRRAAWDIDGPAPELAGKAPTPMGLPGLESWKKRGAESLFKDGCLHCHQVNEVLRQPALDAHKFDKRKDLEVWPLPENVGLVLERDDGLLVKKVEPKSAAERAGLKAGDRLAAAGDRKLFGQADFRGVLHRGPKGAGKLEVRWWRGETLQRAELEFRDGWRTTELGWRKSVADGNIGAHPGFAWPMELKPEQRKKLGLAGGTMAVKPWFGKEADTWPAFKAGLREDDTIVAVGGKSPDLTKAAFMAWFRLQYEPGDSIQLTVRDARGRERQVRYEAPAPGGH